MTRLLIFGLGYTAARIARRVRQDGGSIVATGRDGDIAFDDDGAVRDAARWATHVLSSVPPGEASDPVLDRYGDVLGQRWLGYLSSTGVYGDAGGAWVDEATPVAGRRASRNAADAAWLDRGARVFRLPGIYGPERSPFDRALAGTAHRTGQAAQVFSRVHVDDIASGVVAGFAAPAGAYNLADDLPANQDDVATYAAHLLGLPPPPIVALDSLSPAARAFYAENRRVANGKAQRVLGWCPRYSDYRLGLRALRAMTKPTMASPAPLAARRDHR